MVKTLKFYPHKIHAVHQLLKPDKEKRIAYCELLHRIVLEQDNVLDAFTDLGHYIFDVINCVDQYMSFCTIRLHLRKILGS